jgi:hypothetical protein
MGCCGIGGKHVLVSETQVNFLNEEEDYKRVENTYYEAQKRFENLHISDQIAAHTTKSEFTDAMSYFNRGLIGEYQYGHTLSRFNAAFQSSNDISNVQEYLNTRYSRTDINIWNLDQALIAEEAYVRKVSKDEWLEYQATDTNYKFNYLTKDQDNYPADDEFRKNYSTFGLSIKISPADKYGKTEFDFSKQELPYLEVGKEYSFKAVSLLISNGVINLVAASTDNLTVENEGYIDYTFFGRHTRSNYSANWSETTTTDIKIVDNENSITVLKNDSTDDNPQWNGIFYGLNIPKRPSEDMIVIKFSKDTDSQKSVYTEIFPYKEGIITSLDNLERNTTNFWDCMPVVPFYENTGIKDEEIGFYSSDINDKTLVDENEPILVPEDKKSDWVINSDYNERDLNIQLDKAGYDLKNLSEAIISGVKYKNRNIKKEYLKDENGLSIYENLKSCSLKISSEEFAILKFGENPNYESPIVIQECNKFIEDFIQLVKYIDSGELKFENLSKDNKDKYNTNIDSLDDLADWDNDDKDNIGRKQQFENNKYMFFTYMLNPYSKKQVMKKAMFYYIQELYNKQNENDDNHDMYGMGFYEGKFNKFIEFKSIKESIYKKEDEEKFTYNMESTDDLILDRRYRTITQIKYYMRYGSNYNKNDFFTESEVFNQNGKWYLKTTGEYMTEHKKEIYKVQQYKKKKTSFNKHSYYLTIEDDYELECEYEVINMKFGTYVEYDGYSDGNEYELDQLSKDKIGIPLPVNIFNYMNIFEKDELAYYSKCIEIYVTEIQYIKWYERQFWSIAIKWGLRVWAAIQLAIALLTAQPELIVTAIKTYMIAEAIGFALEKLVEFAIEHWGLDSTSIVVVVIAATAYAYTNDEKILLKALSYEDKAIKYQTELLSIESSELEQKIKDYDNEILSMVNDMESINLEYIDFELTPESIYEDDLLTYPETPSPVTTPIPLI